MELTAGLVFFSALVLSSAQAVEVQGHRGSRWTHPENSLPALEEALDAGADVLEFDLGLTKDGVLILSHDAALNEKICRRKDGSPFTEKKYLYRMTFKETRDVDCGAMINPRFPDQKTVLHTLMPSLDEVFDWLKKHPHPRAKTVAFNIETKIEEPENGVTAAPELFARALAESLKKHRVVERTVVQSFDFRSLGEIRKHLPEVKTALLVWEQTWPEIEKAIELYKPDIVSPPYEWLSRDIVGKIKAKNLSVVPWTLNDPKDWDKYIKMGVDGLITDRPRDLIRFLKTRGTE